MSAPDRDDVLAAMMGRVVYLPDLKSIRRNLTLPHEVLADNARYVAASLRTWADAAEQRLARSPDAYLEEQMTLSSYIAENRQLADQLDPQPDLSCTREKHQYCHASRDGECRHKACPQLRDGEPSRTGRACPLPEHPDSD